MKKRILALLLAMTAGPVLAQPVSDVETIYSDARREQDQTVAREFVGSYLMSAYSLDNQYAKWKVPICLTISGLAPLPTYQMQQRIKEIATQVGAPVDRNEGCIPNIGVIITPDPVATLASIAAKASHLLAAAPKKDQKIPHSAQAWYATFIRDYGARSILAMPWEDMGSFEGIAAMDPLTQISVQAAGNYDTRILDAPKMKANVSRLHTGLTGQMAAALIVIDSSKIVGKTLGSLSDYVAMQALSQTRVTGNCQRVPSIANLLLEECDAANRVTALSNIDTAMLVALYKTPEEPETLQRARIIGNMRETLEAEFVAARKK